jgi:hypothetical protein
MYLRFRLENPLLSGNSFCKVGGELVDDLRPPAEPVLPLEDVPTDRPVEEDELAVHGERCLNAGSTHPILQVSKEVLVALWSLAQSACHANLNGYSTDVASRFDAATTPSPRAMR